MSRTSAGLFSCIHTQITSPALSGECVWGEENQRVLEGLSRQLQTQRSAERYGQTQLQRASVTNSVYKGHDNTDEQSEYISSQVTHAHETEISTETLTDSPNHKNKVL